MIANISEAKIGIHPQAGHSVPTLTHHGGHVGVTGSCHELHYGANRSLLADCGLFQGKDAARHPVLEIEFPVDPITAVVITHAHIDHVGRLPYLLAAGYGGPLICSRPTARLLPLVLEDALRLGFTRKRWLIAKVVAEIEQRLVPLEYNAWHAVDADLRLRLQRAGHILGSAYVEVDTGVSGSCSRGTWGRRTPPCSTRRGRRHGPICWCWNRPTGTGCTRVDGIAGLGCGRSWNARSKTAAPRSCRPSVWDAPRSCCTRSTPSSQTWRRTQRWRAGCGRWM